MVKKVKGLDIYIPPFRPTGNQNSSCLQCEVVYWPALAVGNTVGGHRLPEWMDFRPAVCS